jgi:uncharacterized protein YeaO (DUF488 family)
MAVKIKRIYEPHSKDDGYRILIDRLWPRGIKKEVINKWLKEVAPSTELRKWFNHEPEKWQEFLARYREEISKSPALEELKADNHKHKNVTLLYSAKDEEHNQAVALMKILGIS